MFLLGDIEELSPKDAEIHERLEWIGLNLRVMGREKLIKKYNERFDKKAGTAQRDINLTKQLYADVFTKQKEGIRALWEERMEYTYHKATKAKDHKAATAAGAVAARLLGNPDKETFVPDADEIGNNLYIFAMSPTMERNVAEIAEILKKSGRFDLSKMPAEDAEFTEA